VWRDLCRSGIIKLLSHKTFLLYILPLFFSNLVVDCSLSGVWYLVSVSGACHWTESMGVIEFKPPKMEPNNYQTRRRSSIFPQYLRRKSHRKDSTFASESTTNLWPLAIDD